MPAVSNLVHNTTTGTGTGNLTTVDVNGRRSFNTAFGNGVTTNVFDYFISNRDAAEWERGTGHMSAASTFVRDTVIESSNANAAVSFSAGTKDIFNDIPADRQLVFDAAMSLTSPQKARGRANIDVDGLGDVLNLTFAISASASALTIALKGRDGNDPSTSNPVVVGFRNVTGTTGDYTSLAITAATSLVISSGSTLGVVNNAAFRLWIVGFNDAGTFRLGVIKCSVSVANGITPITEWLGGTSVAEGGAGAADSAGIFYTGTAVSAKAFRILGFAEWAATGIVTAGTWTTTNLLSVQVMGPGIPLPGAMIKQARMTTGSSTTVTTTTPTDTASTITFPPASAANFIRVEACASQRVGSSGQYSYCRVYNGGAGVGPFSAMYTTGGSESISPSTLIAWDWPNSTSNQTYVIKVFNSDNIISASWNFAGFAEMTVTEYMT